MTRLSSSLVARLMLSICATCVLITGSANANTLVWADGMGPFVGAPNWAYDNGGMLATTDNPFTHVGAGGSLGGENIVLVGNNGEVTLNSANQGPFADNSVYEVRVGTIAAAADLSGLNSGANYQGNGVLNVDGVGLKLFTSGSNGTGDLVVGGGAGISGTLNWNSSETLQAFGRLRLADGGVGTINQNGGEVQVSPATGSGGPARIANNGGTGVYNLNDGRLQIGAADGGVGLESVVPLQIGFDEGSNGTLNIGDGIGAAGSASVETWANVSLGRMGAVNINSDGELIVNYASTLGNSSQIYVASGSLDNASLTQNGGRLFTDGLLRLGLNTGTAAYNLNGSSGLVNVRAFEAYANVALNFALDANGATTINVDGNTNTAGDVASGNSVTLANPTLSITGLDTYASSADIVLFNQHDPAASLDGGFANFVQGQLVGQNVAAQDFYLNLFGGDGNDIVLQSTQPSSSTDGLVWNSGAANFDVGWASGNGNFGVAATGVDPFSGLQSLYLGNGGVATFDGTTDTGSGTAVQNLHIGTNKAAAIVAGRNGNGTLTVTGFEDLTTDDAAGTGAKGNLIVGEQGFSGTLNWNSSGTLDVQGQLRVGRSGGTGLITQNAGVVQGGTTSGSGKYLAVGEGSGSNGTYNLNNGALYPSGMGQSPPLRNFRIGSDGATGVLNVGDGVGGAETAVFESDDDLWVGAQGGNGTLVIKPDGALRLFGTDAPLLVGNGGAAHGSIVQEGGSLSTGTLVALGVGNGSTGEIDLNGGTFSTTGELRVGGGGGNGTLRIANTSSASAGGVFVLAQQGGAGSKGRLELTGADASFTVNRLENAPGTAGAALGNDETIRWIADANGVTPVVVVGDNVMNVVELQDPQEVAANTGDAGALMGDGIALELDLSALVGDQELLLIDNRSTEDIIGFFENGSTMDLYEEGESVFGTGFNGTVSISYVGGTGNDVVLSLVAGTVLFGDYNGDNVVDAADYTVWRDNLGANVALPGEDPSQTPGQVTAEDYLVWKNNFGNSAGASLSTASVPEPASLGIALLAISISFAWLTQNRFV